MNKSLTNSVNKNVILKYNNFSKLIITKQKYRQISVLIYSFFLGYY